MTSGIDICKWNYPYMPRTVDFIIQRTSYGLMKDERLLQLQPEVLKVPVRGAYHYVSSAVPWKTQADLFLSLTEKYDFLAWDAEKGYNANTASFVGGIAPALLYLKEQSKKPVLTYLNPDMWATWFAPIQKDLLQFDLWFARYWFVRSCVNPAVPKTMRQDWKFWQWNDRSIDQDVFNGTIEELWKWAHPVPPRYCPTCNQIWPT